MSVTTIPNDVRYRTWVLAGGRCQYRGCNEPLWRDDLTLQAMNRAYLAHIVADSPNGPRGDLELSEELMADPSNIMLLCDTHHRLVDREDVEGHPVELLRHYKREHEERIERQTSVQPSSRTEMVLLGTKILERQGRVSVEQAREAVLADGRYPVSENGIQIDLAGLDVDENDDEFWPLVQKLIDRGLDRYLATLEGPTGHPLNHLSIFALAPIPALIYLGARIGDMIAAQTFQRHRSTDDWLWKPLADLDFDFRVSRPANSGTPARQVAIKLCLSGNVRDDEVDNALGESVPIYSISIDEAVPDFLKAKEQLEIFRTTWRRLLAEVREVHGELCEIHLFPAVPNSVAVELGRSRLPKVDPPLAIYDCDRNRGGFRYILTL
jgi:hypothetical protein